MTTLPSSSTSHSEKSTLLEDGSAAARLSHPADSLIESASCFSMGLMLLFMSLIPPTIAPLLKLVGLSGDSEKGISMLWDATRHKNFYGAIAGLALFGYYNGFEGFRDLFPKTGEDEDHKKRLMDLLASRRELYPKSGLWELEEARMLSGMKRLEEAVELLEGGNKSPLRQVEGLRQFQRSLDYLFLHRYGPASTAFEQVRNFWTTFPCR